MKVILVYNTGSGGHASLKELKQHFSNASIEITDHIKVGQGFEAKLKRRLTKGAVIAVVGGDGTMSNVANLVKDTDAILMPIPGGTLNHFTKDLSIPQSIPEALQYFKSAKKTKIDVGRIDGKVFINNSSIGFYSDSLFERDEHKKKYGKWPAMIVSTLKAFLRYRTYKVTIDGKQYVTPLVFIGNNKYAVHGLTFQRLSLTGGVLSVYMVRGKSRLNLFLASLSLLRGQENMSKKLKSFTTKEVTITTKHTLRVSRDGEYEKMPSPLHYKIQESSVYVLQNNSH
ncbi:MAG TPA: diacylglycerol kinase family protein [Patescibacteria group bacterium]|nr:diacylglycerol kinase family protein [Patescibacteria group bacterium]